jgi:KaiC/GvpD/RAD55 family RecA-like ATPase
MLAQIAHTSLLLAIPVIIGILTLFGKKKKEEKPEEPKPKQAPRPLASPETFTQPVSGLEGGTSFSDVEDNSLNKILQMLMQDIPNPQPGEKSESRSGPPITPDWVPPRITPPSRPMVILPEDKEKKSREETVEVTSDDKLVRPEEHPITSGPSVPESQSFQSFPKLASLEDEMKKLEEEVKKKLEEPEKTPKPAKTGVVTKQEKQDKGELENRSTGKPVPSFEHILELTQGALKSPGLVLVTGPQGSGKTTVCSALAAGYLKQGNPCLLVTYDQSPTDAREAVKKVGCDVSNYESQYRFLLIDGYSAQIESFSMEPYYVEKPFDLANLQETLVRNVQIFMGEPAAVVLDSLDIFPSKLSSKEFAKGFQEIVSKLKESGATLLVTADSTKLSKDFEGPLNDLANCSIELEKAGASGGRIRLRKVGGSAVKSEPESFEFDQAKGLVFV